MCIYIYSRTWKDFRLPAGAPPLMSWVLDRCLEEAASPKINPFSHLKCTSTLLPSALLSSASPRLLGATEGYKQGVMRGRGRCVRDGGVIMTRAFVISIACYRSPRQGLLSHYPRLEPLFIRGLHTRHARALSTRFPRPSSSVSVLTW